VGKRKDKSSRSHLKLSLKKKTTGLPIGVLEGFFGEVTYLHVNRCQINKGEGRMGQINKTPPSARDCKNRTKATIQVEGNEWCLGWRDRLKKKTRKRRAGVTKVKEKKLTRN